MKKVFSILTMLVLTIGLGISLTGCNSSKALSIPSGVLDFDLNKMNETDQKKHDDLVAVFKNIKADSKLAYGTTTTANIFHQLGLNVSAAPESVSLDKELTKKQVNIKEYQAGSDKVANLGSAIKLNLEAIIKLKPDYFFYSDAMMQTATNYKTLEANGIKVIAIPQSNYQDMFILVDALQKAGINNDKLSVKAQEFSEDMTKLQTLMKDKKPLDVAIVQVSGGNMALGKDGMLIKVATSLGINSVFKDSVTSTLNVEKLIEANPDVIFHYTYSMMPGKKDSGFEKTLQDKKYQSLQAVKNNKVVVMGNENYAFAPSADLNITKVMLQLVENAYE